MVAVVKAQVALVDDHPLFRQGLAVAIAGEADLDVAGEVGNAAAAIALANHATLDIAVVDVLMPSMSGISLASELHERQPHCKVLGLSVIDDPSLIAEMLRARACGYALKTQSVEEILLAIRHVLGGIRYLPPSVSRDAVDAALAEHAANPLDRLTRREREVFELVIRGFSNDEVCSKLFISRRTAETHRQRIHNKLSARSVAQLQRIAARYGGLAS